MLFCRELNSLSNDIFFSFVDVVYMLCSWTSKNLLIIRDYNSQEWTKPVLKKSRDELIKYDMLEEDCYDPLFCF